MNKANNKLIVLDYKTRGSPLKENTHEYSQDQLNIYAWLLERLGFQVENFAYLLFYVPKEVLETGEVVFDTILKKMNIITEDAEKLWEKALELLNSECPEKGCQWCERF